MAEEKASGFPNRDEHGRVTGLLDLLAIVFAGLLVGVVGLLVFDVIASLLGWGEFGRASGWLAVVLPLWLLLDDFKAWRGPPGRGLVAIFAAVVGIVLGSLAGAATGYLRPLGAGSVGAAVAALTYAVVWFFGIRWLVGRVGEGKR